MKFGEAYMWEDDSFHRATPPARTLCIVLCVTGSKATVLAVPVEGAAKGGKPWIAGVLAPQWPLLRRLE